MNFTPEVLQIIFSFLDGASLMKCRRVCPSWLREVDYCELLPNVWKNRCVEEVGWDFLPCYIEKINPIYFEDNSVEFSWKDVYICWYRWKLLAKWPPTCRELDIKRPGKIVEAAFYGDWIVYATYEYSVLVACHMAYPSTTAKILYKGARLKNFQFMSSDNPLRSPFSVVFINTERDCCFLDLQERRLIGTGTEVAPGYSDSEWCREMYLTKRDQLKAINPNFEAIQPDLLLPRDDISDFNYHVFEGRELKTKTKWYILHHNVALGISDAPAFQHVIAFAVGKKSKLYYPSVNLGKITTALLHGNNFFVGTSNTTIHRYTIENVEDFLNFDFDRFDWSLKVDNCHVEDKIVSIDVCELFKRPILAVAIGNCRVVLVKFMNDDEEDEQYFPGVFTALGKPC